MPGVGGWEGRGSRLDISLMHIRSARDQPPHRRRNDEVLVYGRHTDGTGNGARGGRKQVLAGSSKTSRTDGTL